MMKMAGPGGFEPPNAGIKTRCLNRLATAQQWCAEIADADCTLLLTRNANQKSHKVAMHFWL